MKASMTTALDLGENGEIFDGDSRYDEGEELENLHTPHDCPYLFRGRWKYNFHSREEKEGDTHHFRYLTHFTYRRYVDTLII